MKSALTLWANLEAARDEKVKRLYVVSQDTFDALLKKRCVSTHYWWMIMVVSACELPAAQGEAVVSA